MQIYSLNDLNKSDKLKVLFLKGTLKQKFSENYVSKLILKEKQLKLMNDIMFLLNTFIVLFFLNEITMITSIIISILNICIVLFKKRIAIYLIKDYKNELDFKFLSLEKEYVKIAMEEEFLNHNISDYLKNFSLKEIFDLSKEDFFKKEQYDLKYLLKREKLNIPDLLEIFDSKDYLEYILLDKKDNDIYNFVADIYNIDNQKLKNYIRENYTSEFVLNNKEKIKEILNKEKDYFSYEIIILNKN